MKQPDNDSKVTKAARPNPRVKGYPRKRVPIPEDQLERDRELSKKLYSVIYALPFLVLIGTALFVWLRD